MLNVKIKLKDSLAKVPLKAHESDACYDVYAHSISGIDDDKVKIGLGFMTEIPTGWKGVVVPRSNLAKTDWIFGNSLGIIDSSYRGEWMIILKYIGSAGRIAHLPYSVGDRVGQIYFEPVQDVSFLSVERLSQTERGAGGFGSTGGITVLEFKNKTHV